MLQLGQLWDDFQQCLATLVGERHPGEAAADVITSRGHRRRQVHQCVVRLGFAVAQRCLRTESTTNVWRQRE
eukprot:COSAG02_NODE_5761_length_4060_cov_1.687453_2_plen_72_part_00